jgi:hypothetical protein
MMTNPEVEELLKQGDAAIQKGDMVPFDERMLQVTEDEK